MSEYVKAFKFLFPYRYDKLLEKYKAIWTKIEDLKNIKVKYFTSLWWQIYKKQNKNIRQ